MNTRLFSITTALLLAAPAAGCSSEGEGGMIVRTGEPIVHCIQYDAEALQALKQGKTRLVVSISSYEPAEEGEIGFSVFSLDAEGERSAQVSRFAVHPLQPFDVEDGDAPHNFQASLEPYAEHLGAEETCFELSFASERLAGEAGRARVSFRLWEIP